MGMRGAGRGGGAVFFLLSEAMLKRVRMHFLCLSSICRCPSQAESLSRRTDSACRGTYCECRIPLVSSMGVLHVHMRLHTIQNMFHTVRYVTVRCWKGNFTCCATEQGNRVRKRALEDIVPWSSTQPPALQLPRSVTQKNKKTGRGHGGRATQHTHSPISPPVRLETRPAGRGRVGRAQDLGGITHCAGIACVACHSAPE